MLQRWRAKKVASKWGLWRLAAYVTLAVVVVHVHAVVHISPLRGLDRPSPRALNRVRVMLRGGIQMRACCWRRRWQRGPDVDVQRRLRITMVEMREADGTGFLQSVSQMTVQVCTTDAP